MYVKSIDKEYLYDYVKQMIALRKAAGLSQRKVAELLDTTASSIARLENGGGKNRHSPTVKTLNKYAEILGYKIQISFEKI